MKSRELLENPNVKTRAISSQAANAEGSEDAENADAEEAPADEEAAEPEEPQEIDGQLFGEGIGGGNAEQGDVLSPQLCQRFFDIGIADAVRI